MGAVIIAFSDLCVEAVGVSFIASYSFLSVYNYSFNNKNFGMSHFSLNVYSCKRKLNVSSFSDTIRRNIFCVDAKLCPQG